MQLDRRSVERGGDRGAQTLQLEALELQFILAQPVLGQDLLVRVDDHHSLGAVDDQELGLVDQRARMMERHDAGDGEAARDDGSMRGGAAHVGDEAGELMLLEQQHVGRRKVMGDEDRALLTATHRAWDVARLAEQCLHHQFDDVEHVVLALAQVVVLHLLELCDKRLGLELERPFGVASLGLDQPARFLRERRILEDHLMHVDERVELGRGVGRDMVTQDGQILADLGDRRLEAHRLLGQARLRHHIVGYLQPRVGDEVRVADGDAAGYADTVDGEAHV